MAYNIGVIGTGYVGLVSGTTFASTGNNVICVDIDEKKVEKLKEGISPIYEPGLDPILKRNIKEERLSFTTDLDYAVLNSEIIFLCLPTPPNEDGSADLQHVKKVASDIAIILKKNNNTEQKIIINKSTVPVGTSEIVKNIFNENYPEHKIAVASNPEFLREGFAVEDAMKPERVVIGTSSDWVKEKLTDLYQPFVRSGNPVYFMDEKSSELTKYAANSFLAAKISFMNDLSKYCEKVGANIDMVRLGMGSDSRIGKRFLFAGIGYGGSCFPKDVQALAYSASQEDIDLKIVNATLKVNKIQIERFFDTIMERYNGNVEGKHFALWGLAFKPNTDDTREAPAFRLIEKLLEKGATITAYDPEAIDNTKLKFGSKINYADGIYQCIENADALIITTEWNVFRTPDMDKIKQILKENIIFDGRNIYELDDMRKHGFEYHSIGRATVIPNR
jgi:UDPglucose 6-dehydrogenase